MRLVPLVIAVAGLAVFAGLAGCTDPPTPPPTPVVTPPTTTIGVDPVAPLLARPLTLPTVAPGAPCPVSPHRMHSPVAQPADARGPGTSQLYPITFYLGENSTIALAPHHTLGTDGLYELKIVWASTTGPYTGPAIVRVGRLDGDGRGHVRHLYDRTSARGDAVVFNLTDTPTDWPSTTFVSGPGCYAYQIDGFDFTDVIVFRVIP